jgi:plasmid stability protein
MTELLVDDIEDDVMEKLQERARPHGRSTEEEVREILRKAVNSEEKPCRVGNRAPGDFSRHR